MTLSDAILTVLRSANRPLSVKEITKKILERKLWRTSGKMEASVRSLIHKDISGIGKKSHVSLFVKTAPGTFRLRYNAEASQGPDSEKPDEAPAESFTFVKSAQLILEKSKGGKPMHYKDITEKALERGWLKTKGQAPWTTMQVGLLDVIKRDKKSGRPPRFFRHGKGFFGLRPPPDSTPPDATFESQIKEHNASVRKELRRRLMTMDPGNFEGLIETLLETLGGVEVKKTSLSHDGGIDVRGTFLMGGVVPVHLAVQVKRWKKSVSVQEVRNVRGSLKDIERGLIITTGLFTEGAKKEACAEGKKAIELVDGAKLVELLAQYEIGLQRSDLRLYEIDETFFTQAQGEEPDEADDSRES